MRKRFGKNSRVIKGLGRDVVLLLFSMADTKFILYVRKFLKNPLLARKQAVSTLFVFLTKLVGY